MPQKVILFNILSSLVMDLVMTFFMTWLNAGLSPLSAIFWPAFLNGALIGFCVALPCSFFLIGPLQKAIMR